MKMTDTLRHIRSLQQSAYDVENALRAQGGYRGPTASRHALRQHDARDEVPDNEDDVVESRTRNGRRARGARKEEPRK